MVYNSNVLEKLQSGLKTVAESRVDRKKAELLRLTTRLDDAAEYIADGQADPEQAPEFRRVYDELIKLTIDQKTPPYIKSQVTVSIVGYRQALEYLESPDYRPAELHADSIEPIASPTQKKLRKVEDAMDSLLRDSRENGGVTITALDDFYHQHFRDLYNGIRDGRYQDGETEKAARSMMERGFSRYNVRLGETIREAETKLRDGKFIDKEKYMLDAEAAEIEKWLGRNDALSWWTRYQLKRKAANIDNLIERYFDKKYKYTKRSSPAAGWVAGLATAGVMFFGGMQAEKFLSSKTQTENTSASAAVVSVSSTSVREENQIKATAQPSSKEKSKQTIAKSTLRYFQGEGLEELSRYFDEDVTFDKFSGLDDVTEFDLHLLRGNIELGEVRTGALSEVFGLTPAQSQRLEDSQEKLNQQYPGYKFSARALIEDSYLAGSSKRLRPVLLEQSQTPTILDEMRIYTSSSHEKSKTSMSKDKATAPSKITLQSIDSAIDQNKREGGLYSYIRPYVESAKSALSELFLNSKKAA